MNPKQVMMVAAPGAAKEPGFSDAHIQKAGRCLTDSSFLEGRGSVVCIHFSQPQAQCQDFGESHSPDF